MVTLRREALDPEIREAVRDLPDFVFSAETVPMMRQNAVFAPVPAPDIERIDLTTDPNGGVALTLLRPATLPMTCRPCTGCMAAGR
jgi:hypothetical protein